MQILSKLIKLNKLINGAFSILVLSIFYILVLLFGKLAHSFFERKTSNTPHWIKSQKLNSKNLESAY